MSRNLHRKRTRRCLLALLLLCRPERADQLSLGRGRGAPGFGRKAFKRQQPHLVWRYFSQVEEAERAERLFASRTLMSLGQFSALLRELGHMKEPLGLCATRMSFSDKVLLVFFWLVNYQDYAVLGRLFGTTRAVISGLIKAALPLLQAHFIAPRADSAEFHAFAQGCRVLDARRRKHPYETQARCELIVRGWHHWLQRHATA